MRFINRKTLAIAGAAAALVAVGSTGTAVAGSLIGSSDIQDDSIRSVDIKDGSVKRADLSKPISRALAHIGQGRRQGPKGDNAYENAYYAVAFYNAGNTNEGAIATVACKSTDDHGCRRWRAGARSRRRCKQPEHPGVLVLPRTHGLAHQHPQGRTASTAGSSSSVATLKPRALATRLPRR